MLRVVIGLEYYEVQSSRIYLAKAFPANMGIFFAMDEQHEENVLMQDFRSCHTDRPTIA